MSSVIIVYSTVIDVCPSRFTTFVKGVSDGASKQSTYNATQRFVTSISTLRSYNIVINVSSTVYTALYQFE